MEVKSILVEEMKKQATSYRSEKSTVIEINEEIKHLEKKIPILSVLFVEKKIKFRPYFSCL